MHGDSCHAAVLQQHSCNDRKWCSQDDDRLYRVTELALNILMRLELPAKHVMAL